jgi:hypothetical protein
MTKEQLSNLKQARDLLRDICEEQVDCVECPLQNNYPFNMCWYEGVDSVYFEQAKENVVSKEN